MAGKVRQWGCWEAIEDAFARGGQGIVYRVRDLTNQRSGCFVLKELLNPKRRKRFEKEIEAVTKLTSHPNVIDVIDYGAFKDPSKPTYVMPEANCSLEGYVAALPMPITVNESLRLFDQIAAGVEHLHEHNIIHRDIKPDNVLMFDDQPKVSDFGLCLIADTSRVTPTEEAVGPRFYMAPELEDGRHLGVTLRADIYSLGKVLYFLLSGGKIFSREKFRDPKWNLSKTFEDDRFRLFDRIFAKTIAPEHDRYRSCTELRADILQVGNDYRSDPRTTLEAKVPNVTTLLEGTSEQLHHLTDQEWIALLDLRRRRRAPYSEAIIAIAAKAISKETAELFGKELLRVRGLIDSKRLTGLAAQVVSSLENGFFLYGHQDSEDLCLLALEDSDQGALRAIAKNALQQTPRVLDKVARRVQELDEECLDSFLMASFNHAYAQREAVLLSLSYGKISQNQLGFLIAGLMDEGSELALDRIAELLRKRSSIEELPEVFQGMVLRANYEKLEKVISKGGYGHFMQKALALLLEASSKAVQADDEVDDDFDE